MPAVADTLAHEPDPIFAAIAGHQLASAEARAAWDRLNDLQEGSGVIEQCEDEATDAFEMQDDIALDLLHTKPTTVAGAAALLGYYVDAVSTAKQFFPENLDDDGNKVDAADIVFTKRPLHLAIFSPEMWPARWRDWRCSHDGSRISKVIGSRQSSGETRGKKRSGKQAAQLKERHTGRTGSKDRVAQRKTPSLVSRLRTSTSCNSIGAGHHRSGSRSRVSHYLADLSKTRGWNAIYRHLA
jgi:hypothetical protein